MTDLYQETILEAFKHPQNKGEVVDPDVVVDEINASCGDGVRITLKTHNHHIIELKWQGEGCAISQSAMSLLSEKILDEGLTQEQVKNLTQDDMLFLLGLDHISSGRTKCLMLGLSALKKPQM